MSYKIKGSYETEIYVTDAGYVAIKQVSPMGEEDAIVLLSAEQLSQVIGELQTHLDDRTSWEFGVDDEEPDAKPPE